MTHRLFTLFLTLLVALGSIAPVLAQTPEATPVVEATPSFREDACMYELPSGLTEDDVICGWLTAPMYRNGTGAVELPVIRVLAVTETPAPEPLVILLGGPGQDMSSVIPLFGDEYPLWRFMLDRQDVILFDQRGMGLSTPSLACPFEADGDGAPGFAIFQCGSQLKAAGIDPAAFSTAASAADINSIRVAFGHDQVDVYGISYGSRLALTAIRDYPAAIRSTIISSPLPLENNVFVDQELGFDHALKLVWEACAADPQCAADNPDPEAAMMRSLARLQKEPASITTIDPATGNELTLPIDHFQFMQVLYLGVFVGPMIPMLPYLVTATAQGDDSLLEMFMPVLLMPGGMTMGALFGILCMDEAAFTTSQETTAAINAAQTAAPIADGTWISLGDQIFIVCRPWGFPASDPIDNEPVVSDKPLLIFTGTFDPITPASNGPIVAANFPNSQLVEFTNQGHDPASFVPECSGPMMTAFLDDPFAPVDGSCADQPIDFSVIAPAATPLASPLAGN
ncbi:MAG: alpha/beta hydrolase [Thermomicrobiales bacterium]|nr:alpha/beta hydrolase [Thermomicrobiales bacterium]